MKQVTLRGIAWNHTRGFLPLVATAQRFEEITRNVSIVWERRSLQAFADASLDALASNFDLIVMDHPHTAMAATMGLVVPLDEWVSSEFLGDQKANSVGLSYGSYSFVDKQWTLATDAAAPIATWRPDLLERNGLSLPQRWEEVLELARSGFVTVSAFPIDVLMHTYMFCDVLGATPFQDTDTLAPDGVLAESLAQLTALVSLCEPVCLERNPIETAEWMSSTDDQRGTYCPFAYGYSNYSRLGYSKHIIQAGGLVSLAGRQLRSTLGGAGVAVSAKSRYLRECVDYAKFVASPDIQRGIYFYSGGQPGHREAWLDPVVNSSSSDFFRNTLKTLDEAIVRGKFFGYMKFQDEATPIAHECVSGKSRPADAARSLNKLYAKCITLKY